MASPGTGTTCARCGGTVPAGSPFSACPSCLVEGALGLQDDRRGDGDPPLRAGDFTLLEKIGEGGFGDVYLAEQTEPIHRVVAVKVLKRGMDTASVVARFSEERQVLSSLRHPGICQFYDAGETGDGRPFLAMELVEGETIDRFASHSRTTGVQVLSAFSEVCRAVEYAHQKGVLHRDIKPSNILIAGAEGNGRPEVKIIDFGLAKAVRDIPAEVTKALEVFGTPAYLAPECQEGVRNASQASDVFSLGRVLEVLGSPCRSEWIVRRATARSPRDRFPSPAAMADAVERALAGKRSPIGRRQVMAGVSALAASGLGAWFFLQDRRESDVVLGLRFPVSITANGVALGMDGTHYDWLEFEGSDGERLLVSFNWHAGSESSGHWIVGGRFPEAPGSAVVPWGSGKEKTILEWYNHVLTGQFSNEEIAAAEELIVEDGTPQVVAEDPLYLPVTLMLHPRIRRYFEAIAREGAGSG